MCVLEYWPLCVFLFYVLARVCVGMCVCGGVYVWVVMGTLTTHDLKYSHFL